MMAAFMGQDLVAQICANGFCSDLLILQNMTGIVNPLVPLTSSLGYDLSTTSRPVTLSCPSWSIVPN